MQLSHTLSLTHIFSHTSRHREQVWHISPQRNTIMQNCHERSFHVRLLPKVQGSYLGTGLAMPVDMRVVAMSMYVSAGS